MKSYRSLLQNWVEEKEQAKQEGKRFLKRPPSFQLEHKEFPMFYRGNMFEKGPGNKARLKLFVNNDWVWVEKRGRKRYGSTCINTKTRCNGTCRR
ncbi:hypothetical protein QRE66_28805 (plasmid) [Bacillus cereus]|nr:hypothetical protein QRE66_28805 [Bacillus cereus]